MKNNAQEIVKQAISGNATRLMSFCLPHIRSILHHRIPAQDIDDVAQDIICKIIIKIKQLQDEGINLNGWVAKLSYNSIADYWRARYRTDMEPMPYFTDDIKTCCDNNKPEDRMITTEEENFLYNAIVRLPEDEKQVIIRFYFDEQSTNEISREMGRPHGTIRRLMHNGRERMREMMGS